MSNRVGGSRVDPQKSQGKQSKRVRTSKHESIELQEVVQPKVQVDKETIESIGIDKRNISIPVNTKQETSSNTLIKDSKKQEENSPLSKDSTKKVDSSEYDHNPKNDQEFDNNIGIIYKSNTNSIAESKNSSKSTTSLKNSTNSFIKDNDDVSIINANQEDYHLKPIYSEGIDEVTGAKLQPIAIDAGSNKISLYQAADGSIIRYNNADKPTTSVFSGGGAKGVGYIGVINALEELDMLDPLESCYGASVGAFTAYLVAIGASANKIKEVANKMQGCKMLYFKQDIGISVRKNKLYSILETIKSLTYYIVKCLVRENKIGNNLEAIVNEAVAEVLLERLEQQDILEKVELQAIIAKLKQQKDNPQNLENTITFDDLNFLSEFLPKIKKLYIPVTAKIDKEYKLVVFSTDNLSHTSISTAVRMSASLPRVFPSYKEHDLLGLDDVEMIDGGCMLNTPHPDALFDTFTQDKGGKKDNSLVFIFDNMTDVYAKKGFFATILEAFLGVPLTKLKYEGKEKQKQHSEDYYTVPTKTLINGKTVSNSTINFFIKDEYRDALQDEAKITTKKALQDRKDTREKFTFPSLEMALHSFNDQDLTDINTNKQGLCDSLINMRETGNVTINKIKSFIQQYDDDTRPKAEKDADLISQLDDMEQKLNQESVFVNWFATFINDVAREDYELSRFLDLTKTSFKGKENNSIFFNAIHQKNAKIEHIKKVSYMIQTYIYPVLHKYTLSNYKRTLILENIEKLQATETAEEVIDIMKTLHSTYSRKRKKNKPLKDVFFLNEIITNFTTKL